MADPRLEVVLEYRKKVRLLACIEHVWKATTPQALAKAAQLRAEAQALEQRYIDLSLRERK